MQKAAAEEDLHSSLSSHDRNKNPLFEMMVGCLLALLSCFLRQSDGGANDIPLGAGLEC